MQKKSTSNLLMLSICKVIYKVQRIKPIELHDQKPHYITNHFNFLQDSPTNSKHPMGAMAEL
ncbi:hypothetical protein NST77_21520 [Niallia sp. FSL W8-0177]|jgi:hypothetical protein|uniref:hypothetical protein n=1 Tax=Niallia sp. FSL W8-0177 TaxID=2954522 RepID=UPI0030F94C74